MGKDRFFTTEDTKNHKECTKRADRCGASRRLTIVSIPIPCRDTLCAFFVVLCVLRGKKYFLFRGLSPPMEATGVHARTLTRPAARGDLSRKRARWGYGSREAIWRSNQAKSCVHCVQAGYRRTRSAILSRPAIRCRRTCATSFAPR